MGMCLWWKAQVYGGDLSRASKIRKESVWDSYLVAFSCGVVASEFKFIYTLLLRSSAFVYFGWGISLCLT